MANVFSTLGHNSKKPLSGVLVVSLIYAIYKAKKQFSKNIAGDSSNKKQSSQQAKKKHKKVGVNAEFIEQMKKLLPICVPGMSKSLYRKLSMLYLHAVKKVSFQRNLVCWSYLQQCSLLVHGWTFGFRASMGKRAKHSEGDSRI